MFGSLIPLVHHMSSSFQALMGPSLIRPKKTKTCGICKKIFDTQGFGSHEQSCRKRHGTEGSWQAHAELLSKEKELGEFIS